MKKTIMKEVNGKFVPVDVDMTEEEIAELKRQVGEVPEMEPTPEERLSMMEDAFAELCKEVFGNG